MKKLFVLTMLLFAATDVFAWSLFKSDQTKVQESMAVLVNGQRQILIEKWHLLAAAKKVVVHDVVMVDVSGATTTSAKNMGGCLVRCTIYWEGPVTKDGYTKIAMFYDSEVQRFTAFRVLSTNGILNSDAAWGAVSILDGLLSR